MAINFGDILGGLGAAYGGRAQEYAEGIRQREQGLTERKRMELEARQKAMYQDGYQAFQMLADGDLDSIIGLANDRLEMLATFPDADPSDTLQVLRDAEAAKAGDPMAIRNLSMTLAGAARTAERMGLVPQQEAPEEYTLSPGEIRYRGGEQIASVPATASEKPSPLSDAGRLARDFELGYISQEQFNALSQQEVSPQPTPLEAVQLERAQAELANAVQTGEAKTAEASDRDMIIKNELIRAYELANSLRNKPGLSGAVGPIQGRLPVFREATADARADLQELGNLLTMANLGRMTGVLSESDIRLIASAASGLDAVASDARAIQKLNEIVERLAANPKVAEYLAGKADMGNQGLFNRADGIVGGL